MTFKIYAIPMNHQIYCKMNDGLVCFNFSSFVFVVSTYGFSIYHLKIKTLGHI